MHTCSRSCLELFLQRLPPRLFTAAAWSGLRPAPESRSRGACPHLSRSFTTLFSLSCCPPFYVSLQHTEAEEVKGFGLPLSKLLTLLGRVAAKADQPGFVRVQRQFELAHSFLEIVKKRPCLVLIIHEWAMASKEAATDYPSPGYSRFADHHPRAPRLRRPVAGRDQQHPAARRPPRSRGLARRQPLADSGQLDRLE